MPGLARSKNAAVFLASALALATGCIIDRGAISGSADAFGADAGTRDAGMDAREPDRGDADVGTRDVGADASCTMASTEECNGLDDDCDRMVDEGFDLSTDLANCGRCGRSCGTPARATSLCQAGECLLECNDGFLDCDGDPSNGCEAPADAASSCGTCANDCTASPGTPVCSGEAGGFACVSGCTAPAILCDGSCVDVTRSASHCGRCGNACEARAGTAGACVASMCDYSCVDGFADCNGVAADGCERSTRTLTDCGTCGTACTLPRATTSCISGTCTFVTCETGFADCNMNRMDGCERSTRTLTDCNACGARCAFDNAGASCATGTCTFTSCTGGFGDCNASLADGCETTLDTTTNCGMCGRSCSFARAAASCVAGGCVMGACEAGYLDCDGMAANGCEADRTSTSSCGRCGVVCAAGQACLAGGCGRMTDVVEVEAGLAFSCARIRDGRVYCWGADGAGQLGNGAAGASLSATQVMGITDAIDLAVGDEHACVVRAGGSVMCWGQNSKDQLGVAGPGTRPSPVMAMTGASDARAISAGTEHTCILRTSGRVACWGRDNQSQLGDGMTGGDRPNAVEVVTITGVLSIDAGGNHTCAVLGAGEVSCWGENAQRQLGDNTTTDRPTPVRVAGIADATQVSAGADFSCAVRSGGTIQCWGANDQGQMGDNSTTSPRGVPVAVERITDAVGVSCGVDHTCAVGGTGTVSCWGSNGSGRVGDGTTMQQLRAVTVPGIMASQVSAGGEHTCAARRDGTAACWGESGSGQLGTGGTADTTAPAAVMGLP